jgi:hypothetical protein
VHEFEVAAPAVLGRTSGITRHADEQLGARAAGICLLAALQPLSQAWHSRMDLAIRRYPGSERNRLPVHFELTKVAKRQLRVMQRHDHLVITQINTALIGYMPTA